MIKQIYSLPKSPFTDNRKWLSRLAVLTIAGLIVFFLINLAKSDDLPFKAGKYVTDQSYCSLNNDQIIDRFTDQAGNHVRSIVTKNPNYLFEFDYHYDSKCGVVGYGTFENEIRFDVECEGEGEKYRSQEVLKKLSSTSFKSGRAVFARCEPSFESQLTSKQIKQVQKNLWAAGFNFGEPDGKLGPKTRAAIKRFQQQNNFPITSELDQATFDRLVKSHNHAQPATVSEVDNNKNKRSDTTNKEDVFELEFWKSVKDSKSIEELQSYLEQYPNGRFAGLVTIYIRKITAEKNTPPSPREGQDKPKIKSAQPIDGNVPSISNIDDSMVSEYRMQSERAEIIRTKIIAEPKRFLSIIQKRVDPFLFRDLDIDEFKSQLGTAIMFVGCTGDPLTAIGFYNVTLNVWFITWIDEKNNIADARISLGFEPKNAPDNTSWFAYLEREKDVFEALKKSFEIQLAAFIHTFGVIILDKPTSESGKL